MKNTLLYIDADPMDARSLRWAHEAGLEVVATGSGGTWVDHQPIDQFQVLASDDVHGLETLAQSQGFERLAGIYSSKERQVMFMAQLGQNLGLRTPSIAAVLRCREKAPLQTLTGLESIPSAEQAENESDARLFSVDALFREGDFVRGGALELCDRTAGQADFGIQGHLEDALEDRLYAALENAAREIELTTGPLGATLSMRGKEIMVRGLRPCFNGALMSCYTSPLALGKSPVQAWFASLAQAGGPFDAMPHRPQACAGWMAIRSDMSGPFESLVGLDRARSCAGIDGARVLLKPGEELADNPIVAVVWGSGEDELHLRQRLALAGRRLVAMQQECPAA